MRRLILTVMLFVSLSTPSFGQFLNHVSIRLTNAQLAGHVNDFTSNHGDDRRLYSPILGRKRDLYVYTPPGYDPRRSYPVIIYLHMAFVDEHYFLGTHALKKLDRMILRGEMPPVVVACADGFYNGENQINGVHSLYVNGRGGRFEDHLVHEVYPFLMQNYSIRPEREAHAILGLSGGGFGGLSIGIRHRHLFGVIATLGSPVNIRYDDLREKGPRENFHPSTYRWKEVYDPEQVYGVFYFGLRQTRAKRYIEPLFGNGPEISSIIRALNPADLLFTTNLQPGELALYCHFPGRDNWNFDAQAMSFAWLASSRGVHVELATMPLETHSLRYFENGQVDAYRWFANHLLPPSGPYILAPEPIQSR